MEENFIKNVIENYNYLKGDNIINKEEEIELLKEAILISYYKKNNIMEYDMNNYEVIFDKKRIFVMKKLDGRNITVFMNPISANGISIKNVNVEV